MHGVTLISSFFTVHLSPAHTVAENGETTATVSLFCDSVDRALHYTACSGVARGRTIPVGSLERVAKIGVITAKYGKNGDDKPGNRHHTTIGAAKLLQSAPDADNPRATLLR